MHACSHTQAVCLYSIELHVHYSVLHANNDKLLIVLPLPKYNNQHIAANVQLHTLR